MDRQRASDDRDNDRPLCRARHLLPGPASYAVALASQWLGSGAVTAADVNTSIGSQCYSSGGGYTHFVDVTISSSRWAGGLLIAPLGDLTLSASACFPVQS